MSPTLEAIAGQVSVVVTIVMITLMDLVKSLLVRFQDRLLTIIIFVIKEIHMAVKVSLNSIRLLKMVIQMLLLQILNILMEKMMITENGIWERTIDGIMMT